MTDVVKGNFNDFGFSLNGHKHNFQATNKSEKDGWLVTIETKAAEAKTAREGIVGSSGYKSRLEKYGMLAHHHSLPMLIDYRCWCRCHHWYYSVSISRNDGQQIPRTYDQRHYDPHHS